MLVRLPIFARWSNCILVFCKRLLVCLFLLFLSQHRGYSSNQDGSMNQTYSVDWNGTVFLVSGDGFLNSSFPTLSLYENNYYVFNNNSTGEFRFSVGEDNNTQYSGLDVWNNGSYSSDEYLLYSPELNSSRILYYFNPEDNASVGQINISPHDSQFFHPQVNVTSFKFGQSVAINDWNQTIIGSPGETISHDGAIHVFNKEVNGSYSYLEEIVPPVLGQNGQFGHALEVENQFLFVSSPDSSTYSGLVDVFTRESNGSYGFTESLNTFADNLDSFGWDISASGNYLAVSSRQSINNGGGKISIFENNGTNWGNVTVLRADDNQSNDEFGYSLNLSGSRLLVGAPKADANGTDSGAAYIFEQNGSGWNQTAKLSPSGLSAGDEFGYSVSLANNLAFVGARQKDGNRTNAGAVYIFHLNGLNWEQVSIIYPPQDQSNQFFSSDLKVNSDILAVSSPSQGEGYVYLYRVENNGSNISLISSLGLDEANSTDQGFLSIALKNGTAIVGIPGDSTFADVGGGALAFHNDAWQMKVLPELAPIIDHNASRNHTIAEDSGIYQYDFNGSHPFDSNLIWSLSLHPDGNASFDLNSTTGMFSYTPDGNFSGIHEFQATLSNENYFDVVDFNVTVTPVQDAPIFITTSLPSGMEGDDYNQTISVFDADDDDNLSLSYNSALVGLNVSGFNIVGVPDGGSANGQAYQDYNVTLSLNDGNVSVQGIFDIRILKRNNPPQIWVNGDSNLSVLPDITLSEDFNETTWYASLPFLDYNDSDGHLVDLNVTVYPTYGNLTWDINATDLNRSISYTPLVPHFNGTDSFTMILRDIEGEGNKSTVLTFNLVVSPVNDPPVISSVPSSTVVNEGDMFHYPLVLLDPDLSDVGSTEVLNVTVENLPPSGWLEYNSTTQILSGTPSWSDYEDAGPRLIVIKVFDHAGLEDTQAFTLQVIPDNYPPVITQGATFSTSLNEDSVLNTWSGLDLSVTGLDQTLGTLTWAISQQAQNGTASVTGTGTTPTSLSYQPDGNFSGTDYFLVQVFESLDPNASDVIRINLNVLPVEDDPVFKSLTSGVAIQDFLFDYNITTFDADLGTNVTISSLVPLPGWLSLSDFGNGSARLRGTPNQYDLGNNLIVLEVRDQTNRFAVQAFMLVVLDENTNPVIAQGETTTFVHTEDLAWNGSSLISATDIDGQFLNWTLKSSPSNGSAQVSGQGSSPPVLDYIPDSNFSGLDSFQVEVSDGIGSDFITINLNIQNVDDAPVFSILPTDQVTIDNQSFAISPKVYDADSLVGSEIQLTGPAWLGVSSFDRSTGVVQLAGVPRESDEGNSSFSLLITDSTGLYNSAEFKVQVRVLNYAPLINSGSALVSVTMIEDDNTSWSAPNLVGADHETSANDLVWSSTKPNFGSVSVSGTGSSPVTFDYYPDGNFSGSDFFTVMVTDGGGIEGSPPKYDTILVNVEVSPVNDAPVFISTPMTDRNESYSWNDESVYIYQVKTYDADWNYEWHTIDLNVSGNLPEWLNFKDEGNGTGLLYGLASVQEEGNYTISLEVFDSNQTSTIQNFTLEIRIDNYPPVFKSVSEANKTISELIVYVDEDSNLSSSRGGWVAPSDYIAVDPDPTKPSAMPLTWTLAENPNSGASVVVQDSPDFGVLDRQRPYLFSYLPRHNFFGDDIIKLKVSDGNRSSILPVRVKVRALPDAPTFTTSFDSVLVAKEGAQFSLDISTVDPDNSPRTIKVFGLPSGGNSWLKLGDQNSTNGSARLFGVAPSQSSGDRYQLAFVVTDETGLFSVLNCQLVVDGKNLSPVIDAGSFMTIRFDSSGQAHPSDIARLYASDREGENLLWSLSPNSLPSFGTASVSGNGTSNPQIKYLPYSSVQKDRFGIRVSDGVSFDAIEITAIIVENFDSFDVTEPTITSTSAGLIFSDHFKISNLTRNSVTQALMLQGPAWLKVKKVTYDLFKLEGMVPDNVTGDFAIKLSFLENNQRKALKEYSLKVLNISPPQLSLKGDQFIQLSVGQTFSDPGYLSTAQDGSDLNDSVEGAVDTSQKGLYQITYRSEDSSGNFSELKRTVQVVDRNDSVRISNITSILPVGLDTFAVLKNGSFLLGSSSESEAIVSKYDNYVELSHPIHTLRFKAQKISIEQILELKDGGFSVCGVFRGNLEFGKNLVTSKGNHNVFILRLDNNFKHVWLKTISCSSTLSNLEQMETIDQSIQIAGNFREQLKLNSQNWNAQGESDNFVMKLSDSGELIWLKTYGGEGTEEMVGIGALSDGSFVTVSNSVKENSPSYSTLVKFSKDGVVTGGKSFPNVNLNQSLGLECINDSLLVVGQFETQLVIDSMAISSSSLSSGFTLSFNSDLELNWMKSFSSTGSTSVREVQTDRFGYPIVVLNYDGNLSIPGSSLIHEALGLNDLMLIKLDPITGAIIWEEPISTAGNDLVTEFQVGPFGTILLGASFTSPFSLNEFSYSVGNQFLVQVESILGKPTFTSFSNLNLQGNTFFHQEIKVLNQPFVRMELIESPPWMNFQDNLNGTGMLGGVPSSTISSTGNVKVRAYNGDGGISDLDFNYSVTSNPEAIISNQTLPSFSSALNFGKEVNISSTTPSSDGKYLIGGTFSQSVKLGQTILRSQGQKDGFVAKVSLSGNIDRSVQLISSGDLSVGSTILGLDGEIYIIGDFSGDLQIGPFSIQSSGGYDLYVAQWSEDGSLKNLSSIGSSSNEYFQEACFFQNSLFLTGQFDGTFSHGAYSVNSNGGKDGFVLEVPSIDISSATWLQSFGGIEDDRVDALAISSMGKIFLAGSYQGTSSFGDITLQSLGLSDCFVGELNNKGIWQNIYSGGGEGADEVNDLYIQKENRVVIAGNFRNSMSWGNREVISNGKQDGFIAVLTDKGNCISFNAYGGTGNDSIDSIQKNSIHSYFVGSFSNEIKLGEKTFSTSGKKDSFLAKLNQEGTSVIDAVQIGGAGDDLMKSITSSFSGHILTTGITTGIMDSSGSLSTAENGSLNSYIALWGPSQFIPILSPTPKKSIPTSSMYRYAFNSGPWPSGTEVTLNIVQKPNWLNIDLFTDGSGLVWGKSPTTDSPDVTTVRFDINSTSLPGLTAEWQVKVLANGSAFSILGNPVLNGVQFEPYRSEFILTGSSFDNILIIPEGFPKWLQLNRISNNRFVIEGTPLERDTGTFPIQVFADKFIDQNFSYQETLEYSLTVQTKMSQEATLTNLGDWKTNWLGYFNTFDNSWTYHEDFLWIYLVAGTQSDNIWFWTERWGWSWTNSENWDATKGEGYLYNSLLSDWLFFRRKQDNVPSAVYHYSLKKWLSYE